MTRLFSLIFAAIIFVATISAGCGGDSKPSTSTENKPPVTEDKPAPAPKTEAGLTGQWYSVKKDSAGVVNSITVLNIVNEKSAEMSTFELTANKFAENEPLQLLWRSENLNVNLTRSGKKIKCTAKIPTMTGEDDITVFEGNYNENAQKIVSDDNTFTKDALDIQNLKNEGLNSYKNNLEKQGNKVEVLGDMEEIEYKSYVNQKIFGI